LKATAEGGNRWLIFGHLLFDLDHFVGTVNAYLDSENRLSHLEKPTDER